MLIFPYKAESVDQMVAPDDIGELSAFALQKAHGANDFWR